MKTALLYAPKSYIDAPQEVRDAVVNGCGTSGWKGYLVPDTIWGLNIVEACRIHDWMYAEGETLVDKDEADRVFLNNMLRLVAAAGGFGLLQALRRRRARIYFEAVSRFGGPAFWHEKNRLENMIAVPVPA